jgi:hypothetical protein
MALGARPEHTEPRWLALLALLAVGGIVMALPASLTLGPPWLVLVLVAGLLVPTVISHRREQHALNHVLGRGVNGLVTVALVGSLTLLIQELPTRQETPEALLRSAAALWVTNILVFASWYWRLDAGGPHQRDRRRGHVDGAFLFPQMTRDAAAKAAAGESVWSPGFVDYLFLAFNTSTALSPTDAPVLSPWAKLLMMLQATISLTIVVLLAARAVNIL